MATLLANVSGDLSNQTAVDFTNALVRARPNTIAITDPDNNLVRIYDPEDWKAVAPDGTWTLPNLIAAADTVVPGTLLWYVDIKVIGGGIVPSGPYVLAAGDQDITDLDPVPFVEFNSAAQVNTGVLATANANTDAVLAAHIAATDPHPQYGRAYDGAGNVIPDFHIMVQSAGSPFNPSAIPENTLVVRF